MKYSRNYGKEHHIQDRLNHRGIFCISKEWIKWSKNYTVRSIRRRDKQRCKIIRNYEDY